MRNRKGKSDFDGERRPAAARVMFFVLGCVHLFVLLHATAFHLGFFQGIYVGAFTMLFFFLCYEGVANPVRSTFWAFIRLFSFFAHIETSGLDTPIVAKLKGDTGSPSYKRYGE